MEPGLTAIVPTWNEEANIEPCLRSVRFADEVIVVDSGSTDRTVEIARRHADRVLEHEYVHSAAQKNWTIPQARHEWILLVDADERVSPELAAEVRATLGRGPQHPGYWIRRENYFLGRRMRHGGWESDRVIRLFRRECRYQEREVHAEIDLPGPLPQLEHPLAHYTFRGFDHYFVKLDRYSRWGARQALREGRRATAATVLLRPVLRFGKMYGLRLGFLDGAHGLVLALLGAFTVYLKYARLWEMTLAERRGSGAQERADAAGPGEGERGPHRGALP